MKYPCGLIQDLLPLYLDNVCSEESKNAIEQHLSECSDCKEIYTSMREPEEIEMDTYNAEHERLKAASFQAVRKKLFRILILVSILTVVVFSMVAFVSMGVLKNNVNVVENADVISVSMTDGDLIGRLQGSDEVYVNIKRVVCTENGEDKNYLFFYVSDTKWNALTTNSEMFSEYTLCPADMGAEQIDAVYYFTGDYTGIESMSNEELQEIIKHSKLLWSK